MRKRFWRGSLRAVHRAVARSGGGAARRLRRLRLGALRRRRPRGRPSGSSFSRRCSGSASSIRRRSASCRSRRRPRATACARGSTRPAASPATSPRGRTGSCPRRPARRSRPATRALLPGTGEVIAVDRRRRVGGRDARGPSGRPPARARDRLRRSGPRGGARPRAFRALPGRPRRRRRREEDARARGARFSTSSSAAAPSTSRSTASSRATASSSRRSSPTSLAAAGGAGAGDGARRLRGRRPLRGRAARGRARGRVRRGRRRGGRGRAAHEGALEGRRALGDRGPDDPRARFSRRTTARFACVVADPPRDGARRGAGPRASRGGSEALFLYVSCDPATLARDLPAILAEGFRIRDARLYDLFAFTHRVEALDRPRAGGVIRPVLAEGEAPAARAAVCLVLGIFLGAWSVGGAPRRGRARRRLGGARWRRSLAAVGARRGVAPGVRRVLARRRVPARAASRIAARAEAARAAFAGTLRARPPGRRRRGSARPISGAASLRAPARRSRAERLWIGGRLVAVSGRGASCSSRGRRRRCRGPIGAIACG